MGNHGASSGHSKIERDMDTFHFLKSAELDKQTSARFSS